MQFRQHNQESKHTQILFYPTSLYPACFWGSIYSTNPMLLTVDKEPYFHMPRKSFQSHFGVSNLADQNRVSYFLLKIKIWEPARLNVKKVESLQKTLA